MTKDSPEMETYSRLLSHLQESCKQKKPDIYEGLVVDFAILISNNEEILRLIEADVRYILPSVLLYSVYKDVDVRNAVIKSFSIFTNIVSRRPSIKNEPWYKDMECSLIAQDFSAHLIKLVEATDDTWPHIWSFVISLIVHDEQVHGVAINSLLKVVEIAFKLSRKFETVLEKAYYCWNKLIDIFSVHPRIVTSQKLIELLVRPLSTNLSLKCPKLKLETWSNLVHKVGFACGNTKCKLVIEPFIDFAYLKDKDSLCHLYPVECISAFQDIVKEKKLYKFCVTKIMSALLKVFASGPSEDLNENIIDIWTTVIENTKEIEKGNVNDYIAELVNKIPQILQMNRPGLNDAIIKTWSNFLHKVGVACGNTKCKLVIEPFIDSAYLKDKDSLSNSYPGACMLVFQDIVKEKKLYRFCVTKIMSALLKVFESGPSEDLNECIIEIWTTVIDNSKEIEKSNMNDYVAELVNKIPQILEINRPGLNDAIIKTCSNLVNKVGLACGNTKCELVIDPFIDFAYLKGSDSLCHKYPEACISVFMDIVKEKKLFRFCVTKIMSTLLTVFESCPSQDLNEYLIEIWSTLIDNMKEIQKENVNDYIAELINKIPQILLINRPGLNDALIKVTLEKKVFSTENLKIFILNHIPIMPIISSFMNHCDFQKHFLAPIVDNLLEHFLEAQNKKSQSSVELEIWDLMCEIFILWLKGLPQESSTVDLELLCSLLLVPLLSKQWSVPVQKTWNSVLEYTQIIVPSNNYLLQFIDKFHKELSESHISAEFAVEFCTFLSNKDKSVFKSLMPTFNFISKSLPSKDPKPLMDLLVLLENSIRYIPKQELIKLLTELMSNSNSYGQPYDLRIKTKITKLQRKLFTLKDPNESNKEQDSQQSKGQEKEQQNGQKTRSPLMAHSNFLHRLAKAEEKKVKKRASMSSIFGDIHQNDEAVEGSSPDNSEEQKMVVKSPLNQTAINGKDSKNDLNKVEVKEVEEKKSLTNHTPLIAKEKKVDSNKEEVKGGEEKKLPLNGRSSPVIPSVVTVVTTPIRKRSVKQSELTLSQESRKAVSKATPPPPSYFEDEAMDCIIIPPKPKSTPLTEHQKEMMSKRRSDIPALYQDLSQDTQSMNSQSIKEIITLKEIKLNDTTKSSDVITVKDDETNNAPAKTDEENNKKEQVEKILIENGVADDLEEIINDTQPNYDSGINLSLTPTKHTTAPPAQKNLLSKFNLLESDENGDSKKVDEEDEVEKENKIVNIEEVALQKPTPIKRRSTRKSTNKYITKKAEETKTKTKKETSDSVASAELIPKGKSKKISETIVKNTGDASPLKVKNPDSQDSLNEIIQSESSSVEGKCMDTSEESLSKSDLEMKEETMLGDDSKIDKTELKNNIIKLSENSTSKVEDEPSDIFVTKTVTVDNKLDTPTIMSEMCDLPSKKDCTDVPTQIISIMSSTECVNSEIKEAPSRKHSGSNSTVVDVSKETISVPCKNKISNEFDTSKKESNDSSGAKDEISDKVLKTDKNSETISSLNESNSGIEMELVESNNVSSSAAINVISPMAHSFDDSDNCKSSNLVHQSNSPDVVILDEELKTKDIENLSTSDENNAKNETKGEEQEDMDMDHNSSGDSIVAGWSMATPEKKSRKRRVSEVNNVEKFSPKLLRSKRLSLTKITPDNSVEKNKKIKSASKVNNINVKGNKISETDTTQDKKTNEDKTKSKKSSTKEETNTVGAIDESVVSDEPNASNNVDSKASSPETEASEERKASKRKNLEQVISPPSQPKKAKTDSNVEEASQESLALLKNNNVKPRKKKIIKSNIKASPNNLEQWLIRSGKAVVKTSLLSSNDQNNVQSESKIINNNSEIQISSSEPKKIIVEMSPVSTSIDTSPKNSEVNATESMPEINAEEKKDDSKMEVDKGEESLNDSVVLNLSDDDGIPSVLEPEVVPQSTVPDPVDDIETIERQFLEAIKRRAKEEEENNQKTQEENLPKPKHKRRSEEEDDDDEELLTESLKCDENEIVRNSIEINRNSNASQLKLESMIYAKYKTTLRRPRRRKRLLRRVKKSDDENELDEELEEEEETFDERRERLTTPFRPSGGRSAQMVKMVTSEEEPPVTPVRRRSITPLHLTENWPEGRCEQWVPCLPTPPGISPSLSILKRKVSPVVSPTSSPINRKKRVSFLDPPVSKGLLYSKGSDNIGQVQHANIPPGKKPVWKGFEGEVEENKSSLNVSKPDEVDEDIVAVEAEDELTAIQEFLNSTPDAPWKDTPLAGDISKIPGILSCSDPVNNIIPRIASAGDEKILSEELQRLKIHTIGGFCSLTVSDIMKLSIRPAKVSTLYNVLKDYFQCQPSSSKKSPTAKLLDDSSKSLEDGEKMDFVETQIEITTLGIEMGVQVDPSEICSDDTFTLPQMSQKAPENTQDYILTPPCVREPELYPDSQEDIKIPTREEIGIMFQSDVFLKRAAPFVTFNFLSKLSAAAADYFGHRPD